MLYLLFLHVALSGQALILNAYSAKKKKEDFCIYFESTFEKHFGFRMERGQMSPPHVPTVSVSDLKEKIHTFKRFKSSTLFAKVRLPTSGQLGCDICEATSRFSSFYGKQPRVLLRC